MINLLEVIDLGWNRNRLCFILKEITLNLPKLCGVFFKIQEPRTVSVSITYSWSRMFSVVRQCTLDSQNIFQNIASLGLKLNWVCWTGRWDLVKEYLLTRAMGDGWILTSWCSPSVWGGTCQKYYHYQHGLTPHSQASTTSPGARQVTQDEADTKINLISYF